MGTQRDGAPMADRRFVAAGKRCVANESSLDPREKETQRGIYPTLPHAHWISDRSNIKAVFIKTAPRCIFLSLSLSPSIFIVPLKLASNSWRLIKHSRISTELNGDVFSSPSPPIYNTQHNRVMKHDEEFLFFFLLDFIHLSTYILISQR